MPRRIILSTPILQNKVHSMIQWCIDGIISSSIKRYDTPFQCRCTWAPADPRGMTTVSFDGDFEGERVGILQKCLVFRLGAPGQGRYRGLFKKIKKYRFGSISQRFRNEHAHTLARVSFFFFISGSGERRYFYSGRRRDLWPDFAGVGGTCRRRGCCYCRRRRRRCCCRYGCRCSDGRLFSEQLGLVFYTPPRPQRSPTPLICRNITLAYRAVIILYSNR